MRGIAFVAFLLFVGCVVATPEPPTPEPSTPEPLAPTPEPPKPTPSPPAPTPSPPAPTPSPPAPTPSPPAPTPSPPAPTPSPPEPTSKPVAPSPSGPTSKPAAPTPTPTAPVTAAPQTSAPSVVPTPAIPPGDSIDVTAQTTTGFNVTTFTNAFNAYFNTTITNVAVGLVNGVQMVNFTVAGTVAEQLSQLSVATIKNLFNIQDVTYVAVTFPPTDKVTVTAKVSANFNLTVFTATFDAFFNTTIVNAQVSGTQLTFDTVGTVANRLNALNVAFVQTYFGISDVTTSETPASTSTTDKKLWIIGVVLGAVVVLGGIAFLVSKRQSRKQDGDYVAV